MQPSEICRLLVWEEEVNVSVEITAVSTFRVEEKMKGDSLVPDYTVSHPRRSIVYSHCLDNLKSGMFIFLFLLVSI